MSGYIVTGNRCLFKGFVQLFRFGQIRVKAIELISCKAKVPAQVFGLELGHQVIFGDALLYQTGCARHHRIDLLLERLQVGPAEILRVVEGAGAALAVPLLESIHAERLVPALR